jgi:hypothetical protein
MKEFHRRTGLVAVAAVVYAGIAVAQQQRAPSAVQLEEEQEEVRRYSVELIVFEYLDNTGSTELFEPEEPLIPDAGDMPITDMGDYGTGVAEDLRGDQPVGIEMEEPAVEESREPGMSDERLAEMLLEPLEEFSTLEKAGFVILDPEDYQLDDIYNRLQRLDAYRPLMRGAWIQPALEQSQTIPLKLRRIGNPPLRLDGTVTLYLSRFLHLVVDMSLEEKGPVRPMGDDRRIRNFGDDRFNARSMFVTPSIYYRIQEDRILRSGELRYYDHPKFGVLAQVERIEEASPASTDDTADLLPANR